MIHEPDHSDHRKGRGACGRILTSFFLVLAGLSTVVAQKASYTDVEVKAALMLRIVSLVTWPEGSFDRPSDPICIGVLGEDPFGSRLEEIAEEIKPLGRRVDVQRYASQSDDLVKSHLVFVSTSFADDPDILENLRGKPVLVFADDERLWSHGVHVNFGVSRSANGGEKVHILTNVQAAKESGIILSSQLIELSKNKGAAP